MTTDDDGNWRNTARKDSLMKKVLPVLFACVVLFGADAKAISAWGSGFGTLTTAQGIGGGRASFQGGLGVADATTVFGTLRYGFSDYLDGRIKLGLRDDNFYDATLLIGVDMTYQLWAVGPQTQDPFDLAFGGMFEYFGPGDVDVWELGAYALGSYPFLLRNGMTISPYGRLNIRLEDYSGDRFSDSELEFGFNGGAKLQINEAMGVYGEFQLDGNDGVFLGIEFLLL